MLGTVPLSSCLSSSRSLRGERRGKVRRREERKETRYREERKGGRWRGGRREDYSSYNRVMMVQSVQV